MAWLLSHLKRSRSGFAWALLLLFALSGCARESPTINLGRLLHQGEEPTLLFEGFHMTSTRGLEPEWDFSARAAQIFEPEKVARAQDIRIIYMRRGRPVSTLTARRGVIRTDSNNMVAEKDVVMVSTDQGVTLRTERLNWDNQRGKLTTDLPVEVERGTNVLTGVGLEADRELKHLDILAQVKISVKSLKELRGPVPTPAPTTAAP